MSPKAHEELFSGWQRYCGGVETLGETELEEVDHRETSLGAHYPWTTLVWLCFPILHEVNTCPPSFTATTMIFCPCTENQTTILKLLKLWTKINRSSIKLLAKIRYLITKKQSITGTEGSWRSIASAYSSCQRYGEENASPATVLQSCDTFQTYNLSKQRWVT